MIRSEERGKVGSEYYVEQKDSMCDDDRWLR